jgi:CRISPR type IV-associated protein Csf2
MKTIDVVLSLTSPLYVAFPDNQDKENISRTTKTPFMVDGRVQYVPIYPANGFRGGLRRKAAYRLGNHFKANEGPIPGDLYLGLSCGASSGSPDQTALSVEEILRARENVYMGLFGGGARLHQSMYRVSDLLPIIDTTIRAGAVPEFCREKIQAKASRESAVGPEYAGPWELLGSRTSIRVDDLYRVMNPAEIANTVADPIQSVARYQAAVLANKKGRKDDDEAKSDVANMMGIETIAAGVPFHFRIDLDVAADDAKLGLLLLCLSDLFSENAFGGWVRCGFGKVRVESMHVQFDDALMKWDQFYDDNGSFELPTEATPFVQAANAAIGNLKIADMAEFFEDFSAGAKAKQKADAKAKKEAKASA